MILDEIEVHDDETTITKIDINTYIDDDEVEQYHFRNVAMIVRDDDEVIEQYM
jgi:hypothetical protein